MESTKSKLEYLADKAASAARRNQTALLSAVLFSLAAYMFVFANKLPNAAEAAELYGQGAALENGHWALYLTGFLFPGYSMPWINGLISAALISVSAALIVSAFRIESRVFQVLFAGLFATFPAQTVTFAYMSVSASYALAVLMAVLSFRFAVQGGKGRRAAAAALLCFSLGVCPAYGLLTVSLCAAFYIREAAKDGGKGKEIVKDALRCFISMVLALILHYVISALTMLFAAAEYDAAAPERLRFFRYSPLMLLGLTSVYILLICAAECLNAKKIRSGLAVCLALLLVGSIFYSNRVYLKRKLEYEEAFSFYSGLITRVKSTEGYDSDTMLILIGDADEKNLFYHADEIDAPDTAWLSEELFGVYDILDFIKYYVGYDYRPIDRDGWERLNVMDEVNKMPLYPYDGSVKKFGDYMVVHLG